MPAVTSRSTLRILLSILVLCSALTPRATAAWIALTGASGWWADHTGNDAAQQVKKLADEKKVVHDVAFTSGGDWILLYGASGYWTSNLSLPACKKIVELQSSRHQLKCLALGPRGNWAILYDQNSFAGEGLAPALQKALTDIAAKNGTFQWLAFTATDGWCLLHDRYGCEAERIPDDCRKQIADAAARESELKSISFAPNGGWIFFLDQGDFRANGIPADARKKLEELHQSSVPHFIAFAPPAVEFDPTQTYTLEIQPSRKVHATLTEDISEPGAQPTEWFVYAPQAPDLPGQSAMSTSFVPAAELIHELSPLGRPVLLARTADHRNQLHCVLTMDGQLSSRRLRVVQPGETAPSVPDLSPEETKYFTRPCTTIDFETPAFRAWMQQNGLTRGANESTLNFGYRTFSFIKSHYTYEYPTQNHTTSQACSAAKTDCGGLSSLFTGIMRANGIPARSRVGRWARSQKPGDTTGDYGHWHVKAEFFARGVGWVPVDGSSALGNRNGQNVFFGNDPGDFITFTNDGDLLLNSFIHGPQNVRDLQGIIYWWRGRGNDTGSHADTMWTVEEGK